MNKRYIVSGIDESGDVHSYATDVLSRAEAMRDQMADDLQGVKIVDDEAEQKLSSPVRSRGEERLSAMRARRRSAIFRS